MAIIETDHAAPAPTAQDLPDSIHRDVPGQVTAGWLEPLTQEGADYLAAVRTLLPEIADAAPGHDRSRTFPATGIEAMRGAGLLHAAVPRHLGGMGLTSLHDLLAGSVALAGADASLAIGIGMHMLSLHGMSAAATRPDAEPARAQALQARLGLLTEAGLVVAAAISELRQDLTRPATTASRTDDGWAITGRKAFCTMSTRADVFQVAVTHRRDGEERYAFAMVPSRAAGVVVHDDWDALGMRASASGTVEFDAVLVPEDSLSDAWPAGGTPDEFFARYMRSGLFHAAATLGVAVAAHDRVITTTNAASERTVEMISANAVDIAAMGSSLSMSARMLDAHADGTADPASAPILFARAQTTKSLVDRLAIDVVDRCLDIVGGRAYLESDALARAWRDVRAGGFMHPMARNKAARTIGRAELGLRPDVRS